MTDIGDIPLTDLLTWDGNVRKTGAQEGLEELMASIQAHGLLQPLVVKPAPDKDKTKGEYPHSGVPNAPWTDTIADLVASAESPWPMPIHNFGLSILMRSWSSIFC